MLRALPWRLLLLRKWNILSSGRLTIAQRLSEQTHEARQVVTAPKSADVSHAGTDRTAKGCIGVELGMIDVQRDRQIEARRALAEAMPLSVPFDNLQFAVLQHRELTEQQFTAERSERRGSTGARCAPGVHGRGGDDRWFLAAFAHGPSSTCEFVRVSEERRALEQ
jgi:hypothetical protein